MTLSLAFLSPTIVQAAVDGTLAQGHGVSTLLELPTDWQKQMEVMAPPR
jgi:site-specific DNA recombinase